MQIVFVNRYFHPDQSATSRMLSDLAFHLAEHGWKVAIIASRQRYDQPAANLPALEEVHGVTVHRVYTSRFGRHFLPGRALDYLTFYLAAAWRLRNLLRPGDLTVVKTDPPLFAVVAAPIVRRRGALLLNWLQDLFPEVAAKLGIPLLKGSAGRLLERLRNLTLRHAAVNVVPGEGMRRYLIAQGVDDARISVIHNWSDSRCIRPLPPESNPLRSAWGLDGCFVVGYSGNLGRAHEFDTLLDAATRLRHRTDIRFFIIGGGAHIPALKAAVAHRDLKNFRFEPHQPAERLCETLSAADVHLVVLRPEMEGLVVPSKLYGIAAAGRPTLFIGAADGEIAAILAREEIGLHCNVGDGALLEEQILGLQADPATRAAMGGKARRIFEARFSDRRAFEHWETLLRRISDLPRKAAPETSHPSPDRV